MAQQPVGYSGTPLAKKLGIFEQSHVVAMQPPAEYLKLLEPLPHGVVFDKGVSQLTDIVHVFSYQKVELKAELEKLRTAIKTSGTVWVSWPKKASKVPTDISENIIREVALPLGFVDVKVCAVSEVWSGLKLVIRKELR